MVQAVIAAGAGVPLELREILLPELADTDVRIRVAAAGVCHSDLSMTNGTLTPRYPLVLGHEAAGVVVEVGPGVTRVAVGDRVVVNWAPPCRTCWFCQRGEPWLCAAVDGVVSPARGALADGTPLHVCLGVGAFAEEVVIDENGVVPLPDGVPLDLGALLGCAVLTGLGAVRNTAGVRGGDSVLVIGLGGVGLSAVIGARLAGASTIIAVDVVAEKESLALAAGATHFLVGLDGLSGAVRKLTEGRGVDHALECVGSAATVRTAWQAARRGGQCTVVGVGRRDEVVSFNPLELFHFARTLTGSVFGSSDPERDIPVLAEQVRSGQLDLGSLVTHRIGLDEVPAAFERMRHGQGARSLIVMDA